MATEQVSVIIPVFNVEKFLRRCIDSVVNQTYQQLEIILIDDGSTDESGEICEEYKRLDSRVKVIHQENRGISAARNVGINNSSGAYITFVDSDDYISKSMVEDFYIKMKKDRADFVVYTEKRSLLRKRILSINSKSVLDFLTSLYSYPAYIKLYKTSIIKDNGIQFDSNLKCCEDAPFVREYMRHCNVIAFIGKQHYYCYNTDNPNSLSKKGCVDYCNYFEVKLLVLQKLIKLIDISEKERDSFISYRAVHGIYCSLDHYFKHFEDRFEELAMKTIGVLGKYILNQDELHEYSSWYSKYLSPNNDNDFSPELLKQYYRCNNGFLKSNLAKIRFYIRNHL